MRGKHANAVPDALTSNGSSPHARETPAAPCRAPSGARLIPACAGNTLAAQFPAKPLAAHPRMRGKHVARQGDDRTVIGSSPHARETPRPSGYPAARSRLIPACAGNTALVATPTTKEAAHPRMRGKHRRHGPTISPVTGSSPHARETLLLLGDLADNIRLIPACAGNTRACRTCRRTASAHPRMRGKHSSMARNSTRWRGSSPHARETPPENVARLARERLIPACAGNTWAGLPSVAEFTAHPRMRGKHPFQRPRAASAVGSSPHARETHPRRPTPSRRNRLIPACAGNTRITRDAP